MSNRFAHGVERASARYAKHCAVAAVVNVAVRALAAHLELLTDAGDIVRNNHGVPGALRTAWFVCELTKAPPGFRNSRLAQLAQLPGRIALLLRRKSQEKAVVSRGTMLASSLCSGFCSCN